MDINVCDYFFIISYYNALRTDYFTAELSKVLYYYNILIMICGEAIKNLHCFIIVKIYGCKSWKMFI